LICIKLAWRGRDHAFLRRRQFRPETDRPARHPDCVGAGTQPSKDDIAMHVPHELQEEFPDEVSFIELLTKTNYEFKRLASRYDEVNRRIFRIESDEEPTSDDVLEKLKKRRLKLKDEIAARLTQLERRMSEPRASVDVGLCCVSTSARLSV
jgi:uncharacterized protein YdcH (DUF465 family)